MIALILQSLIVSPLFGKENNERALEQTPRVITGTVKDAMDEPLPGASVILTGTTQGTVTDIDGKFTIRIPSGVNSIEVTFIGMKSQVVDIKGKNTVSIILEDETIALEEFVAIGYGVQRKETVVGSVSQATEEDLKKIGNVTDLTSALSGQLPGLVSLTGSGEPGGVLTGQSATDLYIRGQNTWNGGQPLILVDGVERDMNNVEVNEVASISVLKDASATAVFGVKGANGVILITTKRGQTGKTRLDFNYSSTAQMVSKLPDKLDSYEALMLRNEMIEREGVLNQSSWGAYVPHELVQRYQKPQKPEYREIYPNVDWADEMFKDVGLSHRASLGIRGGSKVLQFFGSFAYLHEGDMIRDYDNGKGYDPNYNFNRFNFRSNIDANLTNTTKVTLDISGFYSLKNTNYGNEGSGRADGWLWQSAYGLAPSLFVPRYEDGRWGAYQEGGNATQNPLAVFYNLGQRQTRTTQLNFDLSVQQDLKFITKGLTAKASFFYDNSIRSEGGIYDNVNSVRPDEAGTNVRFKQIYPDRYIGPDQDPSEYTLIQPVSQEEYDWYMRPWSIRQESVWAANMSGYIPVFRRMMYQAQLNYSRRFGPHSVSGLGLFKREENARGNMFKNYREDWVFRTTYDYDSRYLFEANGAYNGSEQFGPDYRFEFFPSVAVGWYVSNESFFKAEWVDMLKLRFSMGVVGDDRVGGSRWQYASQYAYGGAAGLNASSNGLSPYTMYRESVVGNPNIRWESALKKNFGLEFGVFRNLLSLNFDYYTENRTDILMTGGSRAIPPFFGTTPPSANLGEVDSKGFEIELGYNQNISRDLHLWSKLAITHNENEVIFRDDAELQYEYLKNAGYPIGQVRSLISSGFYNNWDDVYASVPTETNDLDKLPGYYNLIDFNADGVIKGSEDGPPIGYTGVPQNTVNLSIGANYKRLGFMVQLYGVNNVTRNVEQRSYHLETPLLFAHASDYWSKDNPNASSYLPRWKTQAENKGDYFITDASSFRLRTAEISYSFTGMNWVKNAGISNLRLFMNGNNLFYWSRLPDDRESTAGGSAIAGAYPTMKRVTLGFDLTF